MKILTIPISLKINQHFSTEALVKKTTGGFNQGMSATLHIYCLTAVEDPGELEFSHDEFSGGGHADLDVLHYLTHHEPATTSVLRHFPSTLSAATSIFFDFLAQQTTAKNELFKIE